MSSAGMIASRESPWTTTTTSSWSPNSCTYFSQRRWYSSRSSNSAARLAWYVRRVVLRYNEPPIPNSPKATTTQGMRTASRTTATSHRASKDVSTARRPFRGHSTFLVARLRSVGSPAPLPCKGRHSSDLGAKTQEKFRPVPAT